MSRTRGSVNAQASRPVRRRQLSAVGRLRGRGHGGLDIAARVRIGPLRGVRRRGPGTDHGFQLGTAGGIADLDDFLQFGSAGVEPAPVQNSRRRQRRGRRVVDHSALAAAVRAVPASSRGHPVDDVNGEQLDPALRQRCRQFGGQFAVFVVAHPAGRTVVVDQHSDRRIRFGRGGHVGEVADRVDQFWRKVHAHNTTHCAAVDGHQNE